MTQLLVSVRNESEAAAAIAGGADLIDLKEPRRGALGRCEAAVWRRVCDFVDGRLPVSAALGELLTDGPWPQVLSAPAVQQLQFVKMGLAGCREREDWERVWKTALSALPEGVAVAAVSYVDHADAAAPSPQRVVAAAIESGCRAILFDTSAKRGGVFEFITAEELSRLIETARENSLLTVVAGSLSVESLGQARRLNPDYVAVRGAVCVGGRIGRVDTKRVRGFADLLQRAREPEGFPKTADSPVELRRFA